MARVQWLRKYKDQYVLHFNADGSPYVSSVPVESIMFMDVLENSSSENKRDGPYLLDKVVRQEVMNAYKERDEHITEMS